MCGLMFYITKNDTPVLGFWGELSPDAILWIPEDQPALSEPHLLEIPVIGEWEDAPKRRHFYLMSESLNLPISQDLLVALAQRGQEVEAQRLETDESEEGQDETGNDGEEGDQKTDEEHDADDAEEQGDESKTPASEQEDDKTVKTPTPRRGARSVPKD